MFIYIFINQGLITYFKVDCYYKVYECVNNRLEKVIGVLIIKILSMNLLLKL